MSNNKNRPVHLIVGVGASAGGLEALKRFFQKMPADAPVSFLVVQHLDPNHNSVLAEILGRHTSYKFFEATHNQKIESGHAYIIPPNKFIEVSDHRIKLVEQPEHRGTRMAIDHLFRSMAEQYKSKAVGLIFSGTGSDGTAGLRAVKAAGGLSVAQSPGNAEYPAMPRSAINAGVVDEALPIEDIPEMLIEYASHPYHDIDYQIEQQQANDLAKIRALFKAHENFDLNQYKDSTVRRRLFRRMSLTGINSSAEYSDLLRNSADERQALVQDLLINVTDFFRDKEAFAILSKKVLTRIVEDAKHGEDIRVWVAGCASGEEAYTLAILFMEQIEASGKNVGLKIFATDIDEDAIATARRGRYSSSILSELPEQYVEKYFNETDDGFATVRSNIRDTISFAQQNVYADPPFSRLHLVSCRNLLIYLQQAAQRKVLKSFYASLLPDGFLFLGSSENLGDFKTLFKPLSQKWRIFSRNEHQEKQQYPAVFPTFYTHKDSREQVREKRRNVQQEEEDRVKSTLLLAIKPSIIVDEQNHISYFHGDVNRFLRLPNGQAGLDLFTMLDPDVRTRMRSGIYKARKSGERVYVNYPKSPVSPDKPVTCRSTIVPVPSSGKGEGSVIVSFEELSSETSHPASSAQDISHPDQDRMIDAMERELRETKEELQNTVEELETSTEELKAAHEEALSTNEELQSSNEELEASTEELRSLNEELTTVNAQLKEKIEELSSTHDDIQNFLASTNLATIFLSNELKIKRFTPAAERLLRIGSQDIDQPINELCRELIDENTLEEAQRVLDSLESSESEISTGKNWYVRKILPYQTALKKVDGVVITFIDITSLKTTANRLSASSEQHAVIAKLGMKALSTTNIKNLMDQLVREVCHTLNADFCKILEYQPAHKQLLVTAGVGWDSGLVGSATVPANNLSQAGFTLTTTEPVVVEDLANEQRFSGPELLTEHKVVSGISCIIGNGAAPYGVLGVHTKQKRVFNQEDIHFLLSAANILSVALQRKEMERQLQTNEKRLRIAKDSSHMGAFEWAIDTGETYWDPMLYDIWGLTPDTVTQDDFHHGVHEDDRAMVTEEINKSLDLKGDGHYHVVYRVIHAVNGKITWVEANGQVIFENGQPQKMFGMVADITRQRQLEASLKQAVRELRLANEKKNEFLATLGHEIRNPLASISSATQILSHDKTKLDWALKVLSSNVELVSYLLDELLDLTRISRGEVRLDKSPVNVNQLLEEVVQNFTSSVQQTQQTLQLQLPQEPIVTELDRVRMQQVVNNVISNACKFTPANGKIQVELTRSGETLTILIKDSGIGLDMQYRDKVFEPFQQVKEENTPFNNGLGIGLSLVKDIIELHGGSVSIYSEGKNRGTLVSLSMPILTPPALAVNLAELQASSSSAIASNLHKLRILLVDDNETASDGLAMILSIKGCTVEVCNSAQEALETYSSVQPNVALLDIGLPDMSGIELIKAIKPNLPDSTLYLAITGYGHQEARNSTQAAGFDGHFNKPVQLAELLATLEAFAARLDR